ncbi:MAG TPA: tripartite tricarboxylate transporter TctB family protein [Chloroflexota bacterium]|nr:tripartite tricarboxylate transporter TctB family protein [Chloroflexota bacterium]
MRRINQGAGIVFFVGSVMVMLESRNLEYYTNLGPGPGFFPLWLSGILAALSLIWVIQQSREPSKPLEEGFIPTRTAVFRVVSILGAIVLMGLLMDTVGFQLTALAFLLFLLLVLGRQNLALTLVIAIVGSFGLYYLFTTYLDVALPPSTIPFLAEVGL